MSLGLAIRDTAQPVADAAQTLAYGERETILGVLLCSGCTQSLRRAVLQVGRPRLCVTCKQAVHAKWDPVTRRWKP